MKYITVTYTSKTDTKAVIFINHITRIIICKSGNVGISMSNNTGYIEVLETFEQVMEKINKVK